MITNGRLGRKIAIPGARGLGRPSLAHFLIVTAIAIAAAGCLSISVKSPDGASSASYTGTSIVGGEDVSCGSMAGVVTCSGSGQNIAGLAQAIAPYLAQYYGIPLQPAPTTPIVTATPRPSATATAAPTAAALEQPVR